MLYFVIFSLLQRSDVFEPLPLALPGVLRQVLWFEKKIIDVPRVLPRPLLGEPRELLFVFALISMDENLDDVLVRHQLAPYQAGRGLVSTLLVHRLRARHAQGHGDVALPILEKNLAGHWEVLDAGHGVALDHEPCAERLQLVDCRPAHVVSRERRVGDADALHFFSLPSFVLAVCQSMTFWMILRVPFRSSSNLPSLTTLVFIPRDFSSCSSFFSSNRWSYPRARMSGSSLDTTSYMSPSPPRTALSTALSAPTSST